MKHFTLAQFERSGIAQRMGINNTIDQSHKPHIEELVNNILDPLYEAWHSQTGGGIQITSGYRSKAVNDQLIAQAVAKNGPNLKKVSKNSAHMQGYAADTSPTNGDVTTYWQFVIRWLEQNNIPFDQCIDEYDSNSHWVHIGYKGSDCKKLRHQLMKYLGGKMTKLKLLPKSNKTPQTTSSTQSSSSSSGGSSSQSTTLQSSQQIPNNTGISWAAINWISKEENGLEFGQPLKVTKDKDPFNGYDDGKVTEVKDGKKVYHLTYGYGLAFHPDTKNYMDLVKKSYTQLELEQLYLKTIKNNVDKVKLFAKDNNKTLNQSLIEALVSACYNYGPKFIKKGKTTYIYDVVELIAKNPNNPEIKTAWENLQDNKNRRKREAAWYFNGNNGSYSNSAPAGSSGSFWSSVSDTVNNVYNNVTNTANNIYNSLFGGDDGVRVNYNEYITTGGNTQTGSTDGLLTGNSIYYDKQVEDITASEKTKENNLTFNDLKIYEVNGETVIINEKAVKNNDIYKKDENGDIIYGPDSYPETTDDYILNGGEGETDMLEDDSIYEIEYFDEEFPEDIIDILNVYSMISGLNVDNIDINALNNIANIANISNTTPDIKNALSLLTNVTPKINMQYIEKALDGKVLMFKEVIDALKLLLPVINTLKVLCHILENYLINKQWIKTKQRTNLGNAIRQAAKLIKGLKDLVDLKITNFFVIRTQEMADWAKDTFKNAAIDEDGYMVIGKIDSVTDTLALISGNNADTVILNTYCLTHHITPEIPLNLTLGTTIYFAIDNNMDGTLNGIDNIEYNPELNEIYGSKKSTTPSEILRAQTKKVDPYHVNNSDNELSSELNEYETILKLITFKSDEFEGQQTLNISNLNLCPPELEQDPLVEKNAVIVEFGDEYTMGDKLEYDLKVKPGQTIKKGDVLAYIYTTNKTYKKENNEIVILNSSNNKTIKKVVKTKFSGTIRKSTAEEDLYFYRLYPSATTPTRHFIIDNPSACPVIDFDINEIIKLLKKFKITTELEAFIINCMVPSILPILLLNAKRNNEVFSTNSLTGTSYPPSNIYSTYNSILSVYDSSMNNYLDELINLNSEDNIKANVKNNNSKNNDSSGVNISISHTLQLQKDILNVRQLMINKSIDTYISASMRKDLIGDYSYEDCIGLAYDLNFDFKRKISDVKVEYNNYYINLLKIIPDTTPLNPEIPIKIDDDLVKNIKDTISSNENITINSNTNVFNSSFFDMNSINKQINNAGKITINNQTQHINSNGKFSHEESEKEIDYIKRYKELITKIIDKRLSYEHKSKQEMIELFNNYYFKYINELYGQNGAYANLYERVKNYIDKPNDILKQIENDNIKTKDEEEKYDINKQALTVFIYINSAKITDVSDVPHALTSSNINDTKNLNLILLHIEKKYINTNKLKYKDISYDNIYALYNVIINDYINLSSDKQLIKAKENAYNIIYDLLDKQISRDTIIYIINAEDVINNQKTTLSTNDIAFFNRLINDYYFEVLLKEEAKEIISFWKDILALYKSDYNLDKVTKELLDYANNMNSFAEWPQPTTLKIDNTNYDLYTFANPYIEVKDVDDIFNYVETSEPVPDPSIDLNNNIELKRSNITIMDYEYWVVYMLNATLISIPFLQDGFFSPIIPPIPMPGIYFPIAPPVMIPVVNVLMVFGIAIRGIWPAPIILLVNTTSNDIDAMIFIRMALELGKDIVKNIQNLTEYNIPVVAKEMINNHIKDNEMAQKIADKFRAYSSIIRSIPIENKALIEMEFEKAMVDEMNLQESLNNANNKLANAKNKIKKFDARQIIIREGDLGEGPEPM